MEEKKVSVLVPVYNTEKYLDKCLDSLVSQTIQEIEIVIVNDGSTDSSEEIIQSYMERYPSKIVYFKKENGGQATARNLAIEKCTGQYIGFLDSDDYVKPEMFKKMFDKAIEENADYVACGYTDVCIENGQTVVLKDYVASGVAKQTKDMYINALVSPFLHLYKADIVKNSGVRFPEGFIYEDTAFYINLIPYIEKVACIEEALAYRVRHQNSTTTTISKKRVEQIFNVIDDVLEWYSTHPDTQKYMTEMEYMCSRILLGSSMDRISQVDNSQERKTLQQETFIYLDKCFPKYRENPYYKGGKKNFLLRNLTQNNIGLYVLVLRLKNRLRKQYQ